MDRPPNEALFPGFSDFQFIGRGSYGVVYKATHVQTGSTVAIKMIDRIALQGRVQRDTFEREVRVHSSLDHPFIAHFFREVRDSDAVYLIMELASGGTLYDYLAHNGRFRDMDAQRLFCEIVSTLRYLHQQRGIVHRDIKLENILVDANLRIRLVDFGICGEFTPDAPLLATQCGSFAYAAPEVVRGRKYGPEVDVWSAGVCLFAMLTGSAPFYDKNARVMCDRICSEELSIPHGVTSTCADLLRRMLEKNPKRRITIDEIAAHPWVAGSRYAFYLSDDFMRSARYRVIPPRPCDVDPDVVAAMKRCGVCVDGIGELLMSDSDSEAVAIYKSMRKQRIMRIIGSDQELRMMYHRRRRLDSDMGVLKRFSSPQAKPQMVAAASIMSGKKPVAMERCGRKLTRGDRSNIAKSMVVVSLNAQLEL